MESRLRKIFLIVLLLLPGAAYGQILRNGIADLRAWNPDEQPMLTLSGDTEFYWQQWIASEGITASPTLMRIPGGWNFDHPLPAYGYASYRVHVMLSEARPLRLMLGNIYSGARIWVDGRLVKTIGQLGKTPETAIGDLSNEWDYSFTPAAAAFDIVVEVANFDIFLGGMMTPLRIGTHDGVGDFLLGLAAYSFFLTGSVFIMSLYHFGLFFLRRSDLSTLFYGLFCFCVATYMLGADPSESWSRLTSFGFEARILTYNISWILCISAFLLYIHALFPEEASTRLTYGISGFSFLYLLAIMFMRVRTYVNSTQSYQLVALFCILYSIVVLTRAWRQRRDGARVFFVSVMILFASVIHDLIMVRGYFESLPIAGLGVFIFTFCQSYLLSARFSHAFQRAETSEAEVRDLASTLEIRVEEQTREIRSIMQSIELGIFAIHGPEQRIHRDYSQYLENILETKDLEDRKALPLLFAQSNIPADQRHQVESVVLASLGESSLNFELNKESFPRSMGRQTREGQLRNFELGWNAILNDADEVDKLLVTVNDVTDLRKWEEEARHSAEELSMVAEIINIRETEFRRFVKSSRELLQQNLFLLKNIDTRSVPSKEISKIVLMNLHTIKGAARTLQFRNVAEHIHRLEQSNEIKVEDMREEHEVLSRYMEEYQRLAEEKLGRTAVNQLRLVLPAEEASLAFSCLQTFDPRPALHPLLFALQNQLFTPLPQILEEIMRSADSLARDLDKPRPQVELTAPFLLVESQTDETLRHIFFHLIRNAMDHGIEAANERVKQGKRPEGKLRLHVTPEAEHLVFRLQDDGQGLRLQKISEIAERQGLIAPALGLNPQQIADQMFSIGISTATHITQISGRGLGMSAVARFIYESGGQIRIELLSATPSPGGGYPFVLVMRLPLKNFKSPASLGPESIKFAG